MSLSKKDLVSIDELIVKRLKPIVKRLKPIEKGIRRNHDDINMVIGFFDKDYLALKARVERIESFLKIPPLTY